MNFVIESVTVMVGMLNIIVLIRKTITCGGGFSDYITKNIFIPIIVLFFSIRNTEVCTFFGLNKKHILYNSYNNLILYIISHNTASCCY